MKSKDLRLRAPTYVLLVIASNLSFFTSSALGASSSATSFSASVPFVCSINNNNTSAIALESGESTLSQPDAVKLSALSDTLEVSGNGFSDITFEYTQTKGQEAYYTFLSASSPLLAPRISNYMAYYAMQNGSLVYRSEGDFPRLTSTSRPVKIFFRADVSNTPGEQYEFTVTMTCLQKIQ